MPTKFRPLADLCAILLAGLFIYTWRLGDSPITSTEPLRALVGHQMAHGADLLVPEIYGEVYLRKPPLQYWIIAATEKTIGRGDEFVWRLPSALGSALLAVFLAWWAGRWFGDRARLISGFACLGLIALWAQDRAADIDALDTAASVVAACCILEMAVGPHRRPGMWAIALLISAGAALLLKGPAAAPTILAAIAAAAIVPTGRRLFANPRFYVALILVGLVFAAWVAAVYLTIQRRRLSLDNSGVEEAVARSLLHSPELIGLALLAPLRVLLYALPVSLAIPLAIVVAARFSPGDLRKNRLAVIVCTVAGSLAIGVVAGIVNPRYSYVPLPLLAPLLGGAVAAAADSESKSLRGFLANALRVLLAVVLTAHLILTALAFHFSRRVEPFDFFATPRIELLVAAGVSILLGTLMLFSPARFSSARARALPAMIILLAIPFATLKNAQRARQGALAVSAQLHAAVADDPTVSTAAVMRDLPGVFYYANVSVQAFGEHGLAKLAQAPGPRWVVLESDEFAYWQKTRPGQMSHITPLRLPNDTLYLARYRGGEPNLTTQPAGRSYNGAS